MSSVLEWIYNYVLVSWGFLKKVSLTQEINLQRSVGRNYYCICGYNAHSFRLIWRDINIFINNSYANWNVLLPTHTSEMFWLFSSNNNPPPPTTSVGWPLRLRKHWLSVYAITDHRTMHVVLNWTSWKIGAAFEATSSSCVWYAGLKGSSSDFLTIFLHHCSIGGCLWSFRQTFFMHNH